MNSILSGQNSRNSLQIELEMRIVEGSFEGKVCRTGTAAATAAAAAVAAAAKAKGCSNLQQLLLPAS